MRTPCPCPACISNQSEFKHTNVGYRMDNTKPQILQRPRSAGNKSCVNAVRLNKENYVFARFSRSLICDNYIENYYLYGCTFDKPRKTIFERLPYCTQYCTQFYLPVFGIFVTLFIPNTTNQGGVLLFFVIAMVCFFSFEKHSLKILIKIKITMYKITQNAWIAFKSVVIALSITRIIRKMLRLVLTWVEWRPKTKTGCHGSKLIIKFYLLFL